jgi:hypothetical protein
VHISLNWGCAIVPPISLLPSWVTIVDGIPDVASLALGRLWSRRVAGNVGSIVDIECTCPDVALCWGCSVIVKLLSLIFAKTFRDSTQLLGFLCAFFFADAPTLVRRSRCAGSQALGSI